VKRNRYNRLNTKPFPIFFLPKPAEQIGQLNFTLIFKTLEGLGDAPLIINHGPGPIKIIGAFQTLRAEVRIRSLSKRPSTAGADRSLDPMDILGTPLAKAGKVLRLGRQPQPAKRASLREYEGDQSGPPETPYFILAIRA
jgi:hypothetical protein